MVATAIKAATSVALLALLLVAGGLTMLEDDYLYFPDNPALADVLAGAARDGFAPWPGSADYRGLRRDADDAARATLLVFHGNAGHAGHRTWYGKALRHQGVRVLLAEYPGYGPRPGKPSEAALVADARATLARVRREFPGPVIVAGESLGAAVAAAVARESGVAALLLITPWDKLENVARHHYPWLPAGLLLRDRYDNSARLAAFEGRVAVVVAANDTIVPAALGGALFDALPGPKRLWTVPSADHNDWPDRVGAPWWREITDYLLGGHPPPE